MTMKYLLLVALVCIAAKWSSGEDEDAEKCVPGTIWKDDCDLCYCTAVGQQLCYIKKRCKGGVNPSSNATSCVKGDKWEMGCDSCFCQEDGKAICIRRYCANQTRKSTAAPSIELGLTTPLPGPLDHEQYEQLMNVTNLDVDNIQDWGPEGSGNI